MRNKLIYDSTGDPIVEADISEHLEHLGRLDDIAESATHQSDQLEEIRVAVASVEKAIKDRSTVVGSIVGLVICLAAWNLVGDLLHSKYRYAVWYGTSQEQVFIAKRPHDCSFFAAPLGDKYCDYERTVSTVQWATSKAGTPIISYDEGKTWAEFLPDSSLTIPKEPTVEAVYVAWQKKEE